MSKRVRKINGQKFEHGVHYYCIVCRRSIHWGWNHSGTMDEWDVEIKPNEWLVTCGDDTCQNMLHINPLAYEIRE